MSVNCLVSLLVVSSLASSPSQAASPAGLAKAGVSSSPIQGAPIQGVVLLDVDDQDDAHARVLPKTGLIMVGNPPNKLTSGLIMVGNPPGPKAHGKLGALPGGKARSVTWYAVDGEELTLPFPAGVDLEDVDALLAPAGEWSDVEITFEGELYLDGDVDGLPFGLSLDMDTWTLPLELPVSSDGTAEIVIDLEMPALLADEVLAADGLVVEPGDALHDELVEAFKAAAMARAR